MSRRRAILCADDYGQSEGICDGILRLVEARRLSAVSCFSLAPSWPEAGLRLLPHRQAVHLGLHFNLTEPFGRAARPLSYWLLRSRLPGMPRQALLNELLRQIDAFSQVQNALPDFIDGHEHVHALPGVRDALAAAIALRWSGKDKPYVRAPDALADGGDTPLKASILKFLCRGMASRLRRGGVASPSWFAGVYSLRASADFPGLMAAWLAACPDRGLIMCHPAVGEGDADDAIAAARRREYVYLASEAFASLCRDQDISLGKAA